MVVESPDILKDGLQADEMIIGRSVRERGLGKGGRDLLGERAEVVEGCLGGGVGLRLPGARASAPAVG